MNNSQGVKSFKKEQVLFVTILVFLIVVIMMFSFRALGGGSNNTDFRKRFITYNDNWTVTIDGVSTTESFPAHLKGGKDHAITLSRTLPSTIASYSAIAMRNYHQVMHVYVNGNLIYTYPNNPSDNFTLISDAWNVITLRPEYAEGTLEIILKDPSFRPFNNYIYDIYIGDSNSIIQHISDTASFPFITGIILFVIGLFIVGLSALFRKHIDQRPNIPLALALMFFSLWMMNRSRPAMFSGSNGRIFLLSITALLLVAPFLFLFVARRSEKYRKYAYIGFIVSMLYGIFVVAARSLVRFNAETVTLVAYAFSFLALLLNQKILFDRSFGNDSIPLSREERNLNRIEFFTLALFLIGSLVGILKNNDQLITDISISSRLLINTYSIAYLGIIVWRIYIVAKEREVVSHKLQESRLELMMGQIHPHYMFNTISSIRTMVKVDPDTAYNMLYDFAKYLRASVDNMTNINGIKFSEEVENIRSYANIELVRFSGKLNIEYEIESDDFLVPALSIQPFVENAIKHGVTKKPSGGTVILKSYEDDLNYIVGIKDDGVGIGPEAAYRLFGIPEDTGDIFSDTNRLAQASMEGIIHDVTLLDENGEKLDVYEWLKTSKISGGAPDRHKSAGMANIIMRLREMADARIEISSQVGVGASVKVSFPKNSEMQSHKSE
ncbi:MAG: histidine kinase [Firmicutes bacterium]|nr:histidine kinase [Bacillota bacterium]